MNLNELYGLRASDECSMIYLFQIPTNAEELWLTYQAALRFYENGEELLYNINYALVQMGLAFHAYYEDLINKCDVEWGGGTENPFGNLNPGDFVFPKIPNCDASICPDCPVCPTCPICPGPQPCPECPTCPAPQPCPECPACPNPQPCPEIKPRPCHPNRFPCKCCCHCKKSTKCRKCRK